MNPEKLKMALSNHQQLLMSYKLKGKWVNMCSHREYLTSDSLSVFICTDFHTQVFLCLLKMYVWINQINPTPVLFEAFLAVALFPKGYINKSCKLPFTFFELGMNLTICMFPPGRIPRLLQGKFFPTLTRKGGFLFLHNYCLIEETSFIVFAFLYS